jgi:putative ABC transport system ATP-binding protein
VSTLLVDQVTLGYGTEEAVLKKVTAVVRPGRVLAVTGPSGAGKTTLLLAMAGLLRPRDGSVTLDGQPLRNRNDAAARGVVLIPQDNGLASILTAAENVQVALMAGGMAPAEARRLTAETLERLGLSG